MIYKLANGETIDTSKDLTFDERNLVQKMLIYEYMNVSLEDFQRRWRTPSCPVWHGRATLSDPGPAARILLDLEAKIKKKRRKKAAAPKGAD